MRTDIHAPAAEGFDPEAYTLVDVYDLHQDSGDHREMNGEIDALAARGITQATHSFGCGHCGQHIRYAALLVREDVKEWIFVGSDCLAHRFTDMTAARFTELRKAAALISAQHKVLAAWIEFCAANQGMAYASYITNIRATIERDAAEMGLEPYDAILWSGLDWPLSTAADIVRKSRNYGEATAKQTALVERIMGEIETKWAAFLVKQAERAAAPAAGPVPTGRVVLTGIAGEVKFKENDFGGKFVMLVTLDNGSRVWGTVPASILSEIEKGDRVTFTATVEAKADDASFGFYKRPTSAKILAHTQVAA